MHLFNIPTWPRGALTYFLAQRTYLSPVQTRQQEITVTVEEADVISAWNIANPLTPCSLDVSEPQTFYPSGQIVFWMLRAGDYVPPPNDDSRCNLICQVGWSPRDVKFSFCQQINAYAASMHNVTDGYYDSLKAIPGPNNDGVFQLLMPIGTDGSPTLLAPTGPVLAVLRFAGRTIPLAPGIIGPRRHIFGVHFPEPPEQPG